MTVTVYEITTGKIRRGLVLPEELISLNLAEDEHYVEGPADFSSEYIVDGVITKRPAQETILIGCTLSNLPIGCTIQINCTKYTCSESTAEISLDQYGLYTVQVIAWPYLTKVFDIEYTA